MREPPHHLQPFPSRDLARPHPTPRAEFHGVRHFALSPPCLAGRAVAAWCRNRAARPGTAGRPAMLAPSSDHSATARPEPIGCPPTSMSNGSTGHAGFHKRAPECTSTRRQGCERSLHQGRSVATRQAMNQGELMLPGLTKTLADPAATGRVHAAVRARPRFSATSAGTDRASKI